MNKEKISSQEIIDLVATKASVSKRAAEEFLKVMIASIEEALIGGDIVKIKGFGTFKLLWNEPRKSVNVHTGDEIVLSGFYKIAFAPELSLKELVNEPFSHLEAVQLDGENFILAEAEDEIVLDPLRIFTEQAAEIRDLLSEIQALSPSIQPDAATPVVATEFIVKELPGLDELVEEDVLVDASQLEHIDFVPFVLSESELEAVQESELEFELIPLVLPEVDAEADIVNDSETEIEIIDENSSQPVISIESPMERGGVQPNPGVDFVDPTNYSEPAPVDELVESVPDSSAFFVGVKPLRKHNKWLLILMVLLCLSVGVVGLYLFYPPTKVFAKSMVTKSKAEFFYLKENASMTVMMNTVTGWFVAPLKPINAAPEIIVIPKDTTRADSVFEPIDTLGQLLNNAHVYTEFIASEQIKDGSRLTIMSLKYYGNKDFWVYIYEANRERIPNPDNIEVGTLIRIPKLDARLIDASNKRCIGKARELHDKYTMKKSSEN